ncbi:MAG: single-stranded-DNA-specific exonuclease RecJ [Patescibacteria group bacterium]|jgi:single-stranded-DNA-specific exonuclease
MTTPKIILLSGQIIDNKISAQKLLELVAANRGIKASALDKFLSPASPSSLGPSEFNVSATQLAKSIKRINKAIANKEKILIYGDYDVDGITSTAILWRSLTGLGADVTPYIPHREGDGYGVRHDSVKRFSKEKQTNYSLLITVDNGIVAHKEIEKIKKDGIDVIIVDHHVPDSSLPQAHSIIHSTDTSGAGLAWFLARQFDKAADLGLAALGVVADCLPLFGVNRSIVVHGLQSLRLNPNYGIKKLIDISGQKQDNLGSYELAFILGPRINAVGRLSNPTDALRLLCSSNSLQATRYAKVLDGFNQERQQMQKLSIKNALESVDGNKDRIIITADSSYHPGIIGLVAGKLSEKYYLPSIAISMDDEISKGSCRSIKELNIIEALRQTSDLLLELGGHEAAAGFSISTKNIPKFKKAIAKIVNDKLNGLELSPSVEVDAEMKLSAVNNKNILTLNKLEPFGTGNTEPIFLFRHLTVTSKRLVGANGDHLKLKLDDPTTRNNENVGTDAIAFRKGELDNVIKTGSQVDLVAKLDINTWNGLSYPQLIVKEIFAI